MGSMFPFTRLAKDANALVYNEAKNFDVRDVSHGKFKYTHKIPKGEEGAITSLTLDFTKLTFAIDVMNIDLTGLACPLELEYKDWAIMLRPAKRARR